MEYMTSDGVTIFPSFRHIPGLHQTVHESHRLHKVAVALDDEKGPAVLRLRPYTRAGFSVLRYLRRFAWCSWVHSFIVYEC